MTLYKTAKLEMIIGHSHGSMFIASYTWFVFCMLWITRRINALCVQNSNMLRIRFFPNGSGDGEALISFLKENCDVRTQPISSVDIPPTYYMTGVGIQFYVDKLEKAFNCRWDTHDEWLQSWTWIDWVNARVGLGWVMSVVYC